MQKCDEKKVSDHSPEHVLQQVLMSGLSKNQVKMSQTNIKEN
jgi:hypothetical protein